MQIYLDRLDKSNLNANVLTALILSETARQDLEYLYDENGYYVTWSSLAKYVGLPVPVFTENHWEFMNFTADTLMLTDKLFYRDMRKCLKSKTTKGMLWEDMIQVLPMDSCTYLQETGISQFFIPKKLPEWKAYAFKRGINIQVVAVVYVADPSVHMVWANSKVRALANCEELGEHVFIEALTLLLQIDAPFELDLPGGMLNFSQMQNVMQETFTRTNKQVLYADEKFTYSPAEEENI